MASGGNTGVRASVIALALFLLAGGLSNPLPAAATNPPVTRSLPAPAQVSITNAGFSPTTTVVAAGQSVVFTNNTSANQTVTADSGLFASAPIPPGGAFSVAVPVTGTYTLSAAAGTGILQVGQLVLGGPPTALASANLPSIPIPPVDGSDTGMDPATAVTGSRTRILVGLQPTDTVDDANAVLAEAGAVLAGTIPHAGILLLAIPDTGSFTQLEATVATLRGDSRVAFAVMDGATRDNVVTNLPPGLSPPPNGARAPWTTTQPTPGWIWGLEDSRFPYAWNLLDAVRRNKAPVLTAAVDGGFDLSSVPDLPTATVKDYCIGFCKQADLVHGTEVAGFIAGKYTGGDPAAKFVGIPVNGSLLNFGAHGFSYTSVFLDRFQSALDDAGAGGALAGLRVINISLARDNPNPTAWLLSHPNLDCGPAQNETCTPNNDASYLADAAADGLATQKIAAEAAAKNVLITASAGNDGDQFCVPVDSPGCSAPSDNSDDATVTCKASASPPCHIEPVLSDNVQPFAWASHHWTAGLGADPILVVGADHKDLGFAPVRADFSNVGADVSADGDALAATLPGGGYGFPESGTSFSAPYVAALASLVTAYQPSLTVGEIRSLIIQNAITNTGDPTAAPLIDAFATMLSVPAGVDTSGNVTNSTSLGLFDLADMNDPSADGDNRVVLARGGAVLGADPRTGTSMGNNVQLLTGSDGVIDMRDLRRYRDAWLATCKYDTSGSSDPACPAPSSILLDGGSTNPKLDLNFDGCEFQGTTSSCPTPEHVYSRFDLVGSGDMTLNGQGTLPVGGSGPPVAETSLQLIQSLWGQSRPGTSSTGTPDLEGYLAGDLPNLMVSGDLQIHADDFFNAGATQVQLNVAYNNGSTWVPRPPLTITPNALDGLVMQTVPVDPGGTDVRVSATSTIAGQQVQSPEITTNLKPGQDARVDMCATLLQLTANPARLAASGQGTVTAKLVSCNPSGVGNQQVAFSVAPATTGDHSQASIGPNPPTTTDANGQATVQLNAGPNPGTARVTATITFADGRTLANHLDVIIDAQARVVYSWQETITSYHKVDNSPPGGSSYTSVMDLDTSQPAVLTRQGTLTPVTTSQGTSVHVTETYGPNQVHVNHTLITPSSQGTPVPSFYQTDPNAPFSSDVAVPNLSITRGSSSLIVSGMRYVSGVEPTTQWCPPGPDPNADTDANGNYLPNCGPIYGSGPPFNSYNGSGPVETLVDPAVLQGHFQYTGYDPNACTIGGTLPLCGILTTGAPSGTAIQFAPDVSQDLDMFQNPDGSWLPYTYCGSFNVQFPSNPYPPLPQNPYHFAPGTESGSASYQIAFTATVVEGGNPLPNLTLPNCGSQTGPKAGFTVNPTQAFEGQTVRFQDSSVDTVGISSWHWSFGDGSFADGPSVTHQFADAATYPVTLTVTDAAGQVDVATQNVVVTTAPPTVTVDDQTFPMGGTVEIAATIGSPSRLGAQSLTVTTTSNAAGFSPVTQTDPAGPILIDEGRLPPGVYPVTVTVTDFAGQKAQARATIYVDPPVGGTTAKSLAATKTVLPSAGYKLVAASLPQVNVPALTISSASPAAGATVTVVNSSRNAGQGVAAVLDFGDGRPTARLGAGAVMSTSWFAPGSPQLSMSPATPDALAAVAQLPISVGGAALVPQLAYSGATSGVQSSPVAVQALVTAGSQPLAGRPVTFTLGSASVVVASGFGGSAIGTLTVPVSEPPGAQQLLVSVAAVGSSPAASITIPFTVAGDSPPQVSTGGPYRVLVNDNLLLDASATVDPDGSTPTISWDLGGQGTFGDAQGPKPPAIPFVVAQTLICAGQCVPGVQYPISVKAVDGRGAVTIAATTLTYTQDFLLTINPATQTLTPNATTSYLIGVVTTSGFNQPVTLSVSGLPSDIRTSFSPTLVTPNGTAFLNLSTGPTITPGTYPVTVTGTSGAVTHTTGLSLTVNFGLVPVCYGTVDGTVVGTTGAPLSGAHVTYPTIFGPTFTLTDSSGRFHVGNLPLGQGNSPSTVSLQASAQGYWLQAATVPIGCNIDSTTSFALLGQQTTSVSGQVVQGYGKVALDGTFSVVSTTTPIAGATVSSFDAYNSQQLTTTSAADGSYALSGLGLGLNNGPATGPLIGASLDGYWSFAPDVTLQPGTSNVDNITLVPKCTTSATVRVVDSVTGLPVPGVQVFMTATTQFGNASTTTQISDSQGLVSFSGLTLDENNAPIHWAITAFPNGQGPVSGDQLVNVESCGQTGFGSVKVHIPVPRLGRIQGTVVDSISGAPIPSVPITLDGAGIAETDANGAFGTDVLVGFDSQTTRNGTVGAGVSGYYSSATAVTLTVGQTSVVKLKLLPSLTGTVTGTVSDLATGTPLAGMSVSGGGGSALTDNQGHYTLPVALGYRNAPEVITVGVSDNDSYWGRSGYVLVKAGVLAALNIGVLHKCSTATVSGIVVNANTQQPIAGAAVGDFQGHTADTDASGRYSLTGLPLIQNLPQPLQLQASAPGFISATQSIGIFCGATVTLNFGTTPVSTGTISGRVLDSTGQPVASGVVWTTYGGRTQTDFNGNYSFTDVPPGQAWSVTAESPDTSRFGSQTLGATVAVGATVTLNFNLPALPPTARTQTFSVGFGQQANIGSFALISGNQGVGLQVSGTSTPADGTLTATSFGFLYTPNTNFSGIDSFSYTLTDSSGNSATGTAFVFVGTPGLPSAVSQSISTAYATPVTVSAASGLLTGSSGTGLVASLDGAPGHGSVTVNGDGSYTYTPATGFSGVDSFSFVLTDVAGQTAPGVVVVTVGSPPPPVAQPVGASTPYQTTLVVGASQGLLVGDSGVGLTVVDHSPPANGILTVNPDGSYSYTPASGFFGNDTFTYTVGDVAAQRSTATVRVAVGLPVAPVASPTTYTAAYQTALVVGAGIGLLSRSSGSDIQVTGNTAPAHGTVVVSAAGSFTYTPAAGYTGADSFSYTITDLASRTASATATINVLSPGAPVAVDFAATTGFQQRLVVPASAGLLVQDSGTGISVTGSSAPAHGSASIKPDGSFTYSPAAGFSGLDTFTYTITDSASQSSTANVRIAVLSPSAVFAANYQASTPAGVALVVPAGTGLLSADGGVGLTVFRTSVPAHGTVSAAPDGSYTYTPASGYLGPDSFNYSISDVAGFTAIGFVSITVTAANLPVANPFAASTPYQTALVVTASQGLLSADSGTGIHVTSSTSPLHGAAVVNADGSFTYTPAAGFTGADSFTYTITDAVGQTATGPVTITVTVPAAPVAGSYSESTVYQTALTVNAAQGLLSASTGIGISVTGGTAPGHGTATVNTDGSYVYTPPGGFAGVDTFTYTITDAFARTATGTVTVTVGQPAAPVAANYTQSTAYQTALAVSAAQGVLSNSTGTGITVTGSTPPAHGTATVNADGSYTYTPVSGFAGVDRFTYTIKDAFARTATGTVTVTVGQPAAPVAANYSQSTAYQTALTVSAAQGALSSSTGTGITVTGSTAPAHGTAAVNADGSYTYTPASGFSGVDTFTYTITDAFARTATGTVTVTVGQPAAPVAASYSESTAYQTVLTVNAAQGVLSNSTGTGITVTGSTAPAHGAAAVNADGSYTYRPASGFSGADSFTYTITDTFGRTATGTVTVTIGAPTPPVLHLPADITATATSPQGAAVSFTATATDAQDGTDPVSCTPSSGSNFGFGPTPVSCTATDSAGLVATGGFHITVVDTAPTLHLPAGIVTTATGAQGAVVTYTATATDLHDGTDPVLCQPPSGSTFAIGTTTVNCSATNSAGMKSQGSFTVTVQPSAGSLTYSGQGSQDYLDSANFVAKLTGPGGGSAPSGKTITFTLGNQSVSGKTDSTGTASAQLTLKQTSGSYTLQVAFAGDSSIPAAHLAVPFVIRKEETTLAFVSCAYQASGTQTVKVQLQADGAAISGRQVALSVNGGPSLHATTTSGGVASFSLKQSNGSYSLVASFGGDASYGPATASQTLVVYDKSTFVIWGGNSLSLSQAVTPGMDLPFWGAQWWTQVTAGSFQANASFKGFANQSNPTAKTWTSTPGGSPTPPATVPGYISVIVATKMTKSGSTESGNIAEIAVVKVDNPAGYGPDPSQGANGTVLALLPAS